MSREIYTYTNLTKLPSSKAFQAISMYPQIVVDSDLRKSLKGTVAYDKVQGLFSQTSLDVADFHVLMNVVDERWNSDQTRFNQMVLLSEFVRKKLASVSEKSPDRNWYIGCRRNLGSILGAIRLLISAGASAEDFKEIKEREIQLLVSAWEYLRLHDPSVGLYEQTLRDLCYKEKWDEIFFTLFGNTDFDTIVFHGFYYFTSLQTYVISQLEKAGYHLVFLFDYDERYPYAYEIWERTYSKENGFPDISAWHKDIDTDRNPYGAIFEGEVAHPENNLVLKEYGSIMEFVDSVKRIRAQGYSLYSSDSETANDLLKDYYPEEYGERKLLSYPIGQFIDILNQMWDEDLSTIVLDSDKLIECFSSGWLAKDGVSAKQYMEELYRLIPFFSDCRTITEWEKRISLLQEIRTAAIAPFLGEPDPDDATARWQQSAENPLSNFSVFSVPQKKLDIIMVFIHQLLDMASSLFGNGEQVLVTDHIKKLDLMLRSHEISSELYEEEFDLARDILEKLSEPSGSRLRCFPSDIAKALSVYITNRYDDDEISKATPGFVYQLFFIGSACVKNNSKVHICLCDMERMPGKSKSFIWPLTERTLYDCYDKTKNPFVLNIIKLAGMTPVANRYFLYTALRNKEVTLSWISEMNLKPYAPSPYLVLLSEITGTEIKRPRRISLAKSVLDSASETHRFIEPYCVEKMPPGTIKEARMDYSVCSMKYLLGYVLDRHPVFQSDFQQQYAISSLVNAINGILEGEGVSFDEVYKNVMALFPQLRKAEKRQIYDYASNKEDFHDQKYDTRTEIGERSYTDSRLKIHDPNPVSRAETLSKYARLYTPGGRTSIDLDEKMEKIDVCIFCPHNEYCKNAQYAADQESFYD